MQFGFELAIEITHSVLVCNTRTDSVVRKFREWSKHRVPRLCRRILIVEREEQISPDLIIERRTAHPAMIIKIAKSDEGALRVAASDAD